MSKTPSKKTILITAGPTIEPLDPIRFLSNFSTGEMGFELAKAARRKRHRVILISGPTRLAAPEGVKFIRVRRARCMYKEAFRFFGRAHCVIMAAAVSDFRPAIASKRKIKKSSKDALYLKLKRNPDILAAMGRRKGGRFLVGFSLETNRPLESAKKKLKSKNLDMIVMNKAGQELDPFGSGAKDVVIMDKAGRTRRIRGASKRKIAKLILERIEQSAD